MTPWSKILSSILTIIVIKDRGFRNTVTGCVVVYLKHTFETNFF